jgi:hypothetical protein
MLPQDHHDDKEHVGNEGKTHQEGKLYPWSVEKKQEQIEIPREQPIRLPPVGAAHLHVEVNRTASGLEHQDKDLDVHPRPDDHQESREEGMEFHRQRSV